MGKEIEKKYLIKNLPAHLVFDNEKTIAQTYLATGAEEVRIREKSGASGVSYTFTVKRGKGLVREEWETPIGPNTYRLLLESEGKRDAIHDNKKRQINALLAAGEESVWVKFDTLFLEMECYLVMNAEKAEPYSVPITMKTAYQLAKTGNRVPLRKTRKTLTLNQGDKNYQAEIDSYHDIKGLMVVEVEFPTIEEAESFVPPEWFGNDITEDDTYKNQALWKTIQQ